jgi:hypothetical protein
LNAWQSIYLQLYAIENMTISKYIARKLSRWTAGNLMRWVASHICDITEQLTGERRKTALHLAV